MVLKQFVNYTPQITGPTIIEFPLPNGGVLVKIKLTWVPFTYFNKGTEDEAIQLGDIHVVVGDALSGASIIGQGANVPIDAVVIGLNEDWEWEHQDADFLRSSGIIHKLRPNTAGPFLPDGMLGGNLRLVIDLDPNVGAIHGISIEAEIVSFDSNLS